MECTSITDPLHRFQLHKRTVALTKWTKPLSHDPTERAKLSSTGQLTSGGKKQNKMERRKKRKEKKRTVTLKTKRQRACDDLITHTCTHTAHYFNPAVTMITLEEADQCLTCWYFSAIPICDLSPPLVLTNHKQSESPINSTRFNYTLNKR